MTQSHMTTSFQTNLTDQSYNGWTNYETWNVALWIGNDEGLYHLAQEAGDYQTFKDALEGCITEETFQTPDGVYWDDPKVNIVEINEDVFDF